MAFYRCYNPACTEDDMPGCAFEADVPVCPKCKLDGRTADGKEAIIPILVIHLIVADKAGPIRGAYGQRFAAVCNRALKLDRAGKFRATADPAAVTCKACLEHKDFPPEVDLSTMACLDWRVGKEIKELK